MSRTELYEHSTKQDLVSRVLDLEREVKETKARLKTAQSKNWHSFPPTRGDHKAFNFSAHPTRKIALKFTYDGSFYNGLEFQRDLTPLPTVEEVLWGALVHTRLVDPEGGMEGVGWEKCGRTDRGVSAAGQVVSFRIRSALLGLPAQTASQPTTSSSQPTESAEGVAGVDEEDESTGLDDAFGALSTWDEPPSNTVLPAMNNIRLSSDDNDELKYVSTLNNILPSTIRVLAWSPVSEDFSARFNCRYRHYKYFFLSRGLNIEAMRDGAERLVGEHDFRNLHKLDPAKQLTTFRRRIHRAEINPVDPSNREASSQMYVLDLVGTAFLYNQVRHIMAILFLIGAGLEQPSLVTALLNADPGNPYPPYRPGEPVPPVVTTKPIYMMADSLPLVLWDTSFTDGSVSWRTDYKDAEGPTREAKPFAKNVLTQLRASHERTLVHAALHEHFFKAALQYHDMPPEFFPIGLDSPPIPKGLVIGVPLGGAQHKDTAQYVPVLERGRLDPVEVSNERWRQGKGARKAARNAADNADGGDE
ncbi:tRNA pseudouridine synthase [Phanerochaete sordida]|uniref:tRNA pseudouridine synthase n=1 Tax=Phanerochaete sordida TaxID=48140 RepID=A0A9P3GSS2_9APHY|nr:tRNA pseudouridine synthase [Phanerochaete sordida]